MTVVPAVVCAPGALPRVVGMDETDLVDAYRRFFPVIRAKCTRMLRDPAEAQDLAQETFARLWAQRERLQAQEAVLAWVYRTATRLAVDRLRSTSAARGATSLQVQTLDPTGRLVARQLLADIFGRLQRSELEALILARVDGLTHGEIAQVMQTSERSVRRLLQKADARLQRAAGSA